MDDLDNMDIPDMDEQINAKLEDSFASPFMLEHSTPTLQKVEEGQFQNKNGGLLLWPVMHGNSATIFSKEKMCLQRSEHKKDLW